MLKYFAKLLSSLSSNTDSRAIAHALSMGLLLGFMPKDNLLWYVFFIFAFFMRIQRSALALSTILGAILASLMDPFFHTIGYWILTISPAQSFFLKLLDTPFMTFTKFNNTVVMGSLAFSLVAYFPFYGIGRLFVFIWRKYLGGRVRKLKVIKALKNLPFIKKISNIVQEM